MNSVSKRIDTLFLKYIVNVVGPGVRHISVRVWDSRNRARIRQSFRFKYLEPNWDQHSFKLMDWVCDARLLLLWLQPIYPGHMCVGSQTPSNEQEREYNCNYTVFSVKTVWIWSEARHNFEVFVQTWYTGTGQVAILSVHKFHKLPVPWIVIS